MFIRSKMSAHVCWDLRILLGVGDMLAKKAPIDMNAWRGVGRRN